ncbi:DUF4083 family protein [Paenibacillus whitsoniae]|uniref:DUF4083 domain-containing protein n=1 Tax=Paenibacillus whitsoniae TaxID=2496558 RepID=A0A3R9ZZ75_9BACL|nr:DUF4083 domain-containing protein [Paenibacillus whitsoniae]
MTANVDSTCRFAKNRRVYECVFNSDVCNAAISTLLVIFICIGIGAALRYFSWRKKQASELNRRLDRVIELLEGERG